MIQAIQKILKDGDKEELRALFGFDSTNSIEEIVLKFNLYARHFHPEYFEVADAPFHMEIDIYNTQIYTGEFKYFVDIAFRGGAKTTRTKLFMAFVIANDKDRKRKYLKILSKDPKNATRSVTGIYNSFINAKVEKYYPEIFSKTKRKREETMSSFTTSTGIKLTAGSVGTDQRGELQDESRPDFIWFDDFETRKTLRSSAITQAIWDNMEEAKTGLSKDGGAIYTCNYISESGNVHKLVKPSSNKKILIVPIIKDGVPAWGRYTVADIEAIKEDEDGNEGDFEGEYLCEPAKSKDIFFDRERLNNQKTKTPIKELSGFRIYGEFNPSHRYGGGGDAGLGVGLDSSATVFINFSLYPCEVVAAYSCNTIAPDIFGDEILRQAEMFGICLFGQEKNYPGNTTIVRLKQIYDLKKLFETPSKGVKTEEGKPTEYGWHTNGATKSTMLFALRKAVEDGQLIINDPQLLAELMKYTRNDLMDTNTDPRLTTRHFDLLMACAIAWQMRNFATVKEEEKPDFVKKQNRRV